MIGGWPLSRNAPEKVMFGNLRNGFLTKKEYFSAMTAVIILGLNPYYIKTGTFHIVVEGVCLFHTISKYRNHNLSARFQQNVQSTENLVAGHIPVKFLFPFCFSLTIPYISYYNKNMFLAKE